MGDLADRPNYFIEKIWAGLDVDDATYEQWMGEDGILDREMGDTLSIGYPEYHTPKIHAIYRDLDETFTAGVNLKILSGRIDKLIQVVPDMKCISVQTIEVKFHPEIRKYQTFRGLIDGEWVKSDVFVDGKWINGEVIERLAINEGFDSVEHFFRYFNRDYTGKIIHWTDKKY